MPDGVNLGSAWGSVEISTDGATQSVNSLAASMRSAGTAMSAALTLPLVGIGVAAVNSAGEFEQSMNIMAQVSSATGEQMAQMQAQALEMGAVTSFSAGEAAQAQLELAKAGLEPAEVMGALGGVMDLAAAGNLDLATAATIAANAMNAFQLPAEATTDVANMLAAAANASSVDVNDLAQGMQMAGAVFSSSGQSVGDLTTALAILGNNAITGSDAGTSLKTMLMRLAAPTDDAAGAMQALGLEVFNADGSMRGFGDIVGQLERATAGLTDQERSMALQTIFGADAIRAATILAREGVDGFNEMGAAVGKQGAATATANARMKGMNGALEYLKGSIDSFLIGAALPFLDSMSGIVRVVADGISAIGNLPEPVRNAALAFAAVLAAAGPLMLAISGIGTAIGFLLSPVGLLVAGATALTAGLVLWNQNFMGIQGRAAQFAQTLKGMAEAATGIDFDGVADGLRAFGSYIAAVVEDGDTLNDWLAELPAPIQPAVQAIGGLVAAFAGLVQTGDLGAFVQSIQAIDWGGALASVTDSLAGLASGVAAALQSVDWGGALATAGGWLDGLKDGVISAVQSVDWAGGLAAAGEWLAGLRDGVVGSVTSIDWGAALTTAGEWLTGLTGGVVSAVQSVDWGGGLTAAGDFLGGLWGGVVTALQSIDWGVHLAAAGEWLAGLWGSVVVAVQAIDWGGYLTAAGDWLAGLWGSVTGALTAIDWGAHLATAAGWLDTLKANVVSAIQGIDWAGALTATGDAFGGLETAVTDGLGALGFEGAGEKLDGLKEAFTGLPASVNSARQTLTSFGAQASVALAPVAAFFAPALGRLQTTFANLPTSLAPLLPKLGALGAAFGELLTALQPFVMLVGAGLALAANFGIERLSTAFDSLPELLGPIIDQITATIRLITTVLTEVVAGVTAIINGDWTAAWESGKAIITAFGTFFRGLFSRLGTFMGAVARNMVQPILNVFKTLGVDITPTLEGIRKMFEDVWAKVLTYIQPVIDLIGTLTTVIDEFKQFLSGLSLPNPFDALASAADAVRNALGEFGAGVVAGVTGTPVVDADNNPATPEAGGTSYFSGGLAQIDERGYEQIVLPAGSRVYTAGQTNNLPTSEVRNININLGGVTVNSPMDAQRLGNLLRDQLVMAGV